MNGLSRTRARVAPVGSTRSSGLKVGKNRGRFAGRDEEIFASRPDIVVNQEFAGDRTLFEIIVGPHPNVVLDVFHFHAGFPTEAGALATDEQLIAESDIVFGDDDRGG
ncbi:MAG: hypothetical protein R3F44_12430 [Candidatus Competibacteraceae bacterium]